MPRRLLLAAAVAVPAAALAEAVPAALFNGAADRGIGRGSAASEVLGAALRGRAAVAAARGLPFAPPPAHLATRAVLPGVPVPKGAPLASLSWGRADRGRLINGAELSPEGAHWRSIRPEVRRLFGTSELVDGLRWTAERLRAADPETPPLAVGDLSTEGGGRAPRHRSHQNGRDADLNFFWTDASGRPVFAERMAGFDGKGRGVYAGRPVRFDARRNWRLVAALLTNPYFGREVRWLFVSRGLRGLLLKEGRAAGAPEPLLARAAAVLAQPPGSSHRNHFHLRIACSPDDARQGCRD